MRLRPHIRVQPRRDQLQAFARWAVAQEPKVATCDAHAFTVPTHQFGDVPCELLVGALVDGQRWQPPEPVPDRPDVGVCGVCGKEFSTLRGAAAHERMKHGGGRGGR